MRAIALAVLVPSLAAAQVSVPATIGYQGRLLKADGTAETGSFQMRFALFPGATGGTAVWSEDQTVTASNGFYAVSLGQVQPLDPSIFAQPGLYLEVAVGNEPPFSPRMGIQSVPFAIAAGTAGDAEALGGRAPSEYVLSANLAAAGYLTQLDAAATYLSKADAVATYLSLADASLTYLTRAAADSTFLPLGGTAADSAQLGGSPAADYLKRADAAFVQLSPPAPQPGGFSLAGDGDLGGALNVSGPITAGSLAAGGSSFGGAVLVAGPVQAAAVSAATLTAVGLVHGGATTALFGAVADVPFTPATSLAEAIPGLSAPVALEREALMLLSVSGSASNAGPAPCQSGLGLRVDGVDSVPQSYVQVVPGAIGGLGFTAHRFLPAGTHTVEATVSGGTPGCLAFCQATDCRLEVIAVYQ